MVDLVRYVAAAWTVAFALRARLFGAATLAAVVLYVYAAEVASVLALGRGVVGSIEAGFGAIFIGPSVWPARGDGALPWSGSIGRHAIAAHATAAIFALASFTMAHRASALRRPETVLARRASRTATAALLVVCLEAIGFVVLALFAVLAR